MSPRSALGDLEHLKSPLSWRAGQFNTLDVMDAEADFFDLFDHFNKLGGRFIVAPANSIASWMREASSLICVPQSMRSRHASVETSL
jgi:hypothetical protein